MSSGLSGNSTDLSHKGGYVDTKRVPHAVHLLYVFSYCSFIQIVFQVYDSEAGGCEEGVGEGGLPGPEGTCGGGCPGGGAQPPAVTQRGGWRPTQPDPHANADP